MQRVLSRASGILSFARSVQEHHSALCLVAYLIVEREQLDHEDTRRQRKRQLILREPKGGLPSLERVRSAA